MTYEEKKARFKRIREIDDGYVCRTETNFLLNELEKAWKVLEQYADIRRVEEWEYNGGHRPAVRALHE